MLIFFFFQAEDGIRDDLVTGVQTCALPISCGLDSRVAGMLPSVGRPRVGNDDPNVALRHMKNARQFVAVRKRPLRSGPYRSEERRVGKECRCRRTRYQVDTTDDTWDK